MSRRTSGGAWWGVAAIATAAACAGGGDGGLGGCRDARDCAGGQVCVDGACLDAGDPGPGPGPGGCVTHDDCAGGEVCDAGRCVPACTADMDCDGGRGACRDHRCIARCTADADCEAPGLICEQSGCVPAQCANDTACGAGRVCQGGRCADDTGCTGDIECPPSQRCLEGACAPRETCGVDTSCPPDHLCRDGFCFAAVPCAADGDCTGGDDCVAGLCRPHRCRGRGECTPPATCVLGACAEPAPPELIARVAILTPGGVIAPGASVRLQAIALDAEGRAVPGATFDWASTAEAVAAVDAAGKLQGGRDAGSAAITAGARGTSPLVVSEPVVFVNPGPPPERGLRVTVVDRLTGAPIEGASVVGGAATATTGPAGTVSFDAAAPVLVTAMRAGHDYTSVLHTAAGSADLVLPLAPVGTAALDAGDAGGFTGLVDFSAVKTEGVMEVGLTGTSLGGDLADAELQHLIGEIFPTDIDIPLLGGSGLYLAGGLTLKVDLPALLLPDTVLRERFEIVGLPGRRAVWSFGGRLSQTVVNELLAVVFEAGGSINAPQLVATLLPYLAVFDHDLQPALDVTPRPRVPDTTDRDGDGDAAERVPDYAGFPELVMTPHHEQSLPLTVDVPVLPSLRGQPLRAVMVLAGAVVDGLGFVPLGVSGANAGFAGTVATVSMSAAPIYGGLEAGAWAVLAVAFPFDAGQGVFNLPTEMAVKWSRYDALPRHVAFGEDFLAMPETAAWDAAARRLSVSAPGGTGLVRIVLRGASGGRWVVWLPPGATEATLPRPPAGLDDPTSAARVSVVAVGLGEGVDAPALFSASGPGLARLNDVMTGFSRVDVEAR